MKNKAKIEIQVHETAESLEVDVQVNGDSHNVARGLLVALAEVIVKTHKGDVEDAAIKTCSLLIRTIDKMVKEGANDANLPN